MPRSQPLISVAIAARNYGRYLPRALDSVFRCHNPTNAPLQVVVADDASTDNTPAILADYRRRHPRELEVITIRTPAGVGAAKNAALDGCTGHFVALLDADDEFLPEKLIHAHAALQRTGVDFVTNDFYHQTEGGERVRRDRRNWSEWFWPPSTWMFRRGLVRFNPYRLGGDDPEWLERRWHVVQHRHRHLDELLNVQHLHPENAHRQPRTRVPGLQAAYRLLGKPHPDDLLAPSGWSCRACGNQYLLPTSCCTRATVQRPLYFYMATLSPWHQQRTEFSLVMPTRDDLALTRRAVSSLLATLPPSRSHTVELIFVDGYSTDGTLDYIRHLARSYPVKLILTHPEEPFQYARACNRGALAAVGRYLFLLNNDIELHSPNPWEPLRAALSDPRVGVVGNSTVWGPGQREAEWEGGTQQYQYVERPLTGAFWGTRRELYWELGGLDEALTGYGYEELDFQFRAQLAHYRWAQARVTIHHGPLASLDASRGQPSASRTWAEESRVIAVSNEVAALQATLAEAAEDARCWSGRLQVVIVVAGAGEKTAEVLEKYRGRLGPRLTVVRVEEGIGRARAQAIGQARAVGQLVRLLGPGDWA